MKTIYVAEIKEVRVGNIVDMRVERKQAIKDDTQTLNLRGVQ